MPEQELPQRRVVVALEPRFGLREPDRGGNAHGVARALHGPGMSGMMHIMAAVGGGTIRLRGKHEDRRIVRRDKPEHVDFREDGFHLWGGKLLAVPGSVKRRGFARVLPIRRRRPEVLRPALHMIGGLGVDRAGGDKARGFPQDGIVGLGIRKVGMEREPERAAGTG